MILRQAQDKREEIKMEENSPEKSSEENIKHTPTGLPMSEPEESDYDFRRRLSESFHADRNQAVVERGERIQSWKDRKATSRQLDSSGGMRKINRQAIRNTRSKG